MCGKPCSRCFRTVPRKKRKRVSLSFFSFLRLFYDTLETLVTSSSSSSSLLVRPYQLKWYYLYHRPAQRTRRWRAREREGERGERAPKKIRGRGVCRTRKRGRFLNLKRKIKEIPRARDESEPKEKRKNAPNSRCACARAWASLPPPLAVALIFETSLYF